MASTPTICRMVVFHHPGEGMIDGVPRDYPAVILEVSGGPISGSSGEDTDLQTEEGPAPIADPYVCLLEVLRPRGTEWVRATEGKGLGQWSWPEGTADRDALADRVTALETLIHSIVTDEEESS